MRISFFIFLLLFSLQLFAADKKLEVLLKKADLVSGNPALPVNVLDLFMLNGMRQAITTELADLNLDSESFWKRIEEKKMTDADEISFFNPFFISKSLAVSDVEQPEDVFKRATFMYELDSTKTKKLFDETLINLPDLTLKTFYILPSITIDKDMNWSDVGVSKSENFSGVIIDSWKKWAAAQFKNYPNVVILEQDITGKYEAINAESVILKWNSNVKRGEVYQDRKSAFFEVSAQYVLTNAKSGDSLVAFDFPTQKREVGIGQAKDLSSSLASLIYNLLNSQTAKISGALELNKASSTLSTVEIKVTGKHGLFDITQINSMLAEKFKDLALTSELKSYSSEASVISIKSTLNADSLSAVLSKDGGKIPLNEQKILLFNPSDKTFAIIPKEANN